MANFKKTSCSVGTYLPTYLPTYLTNLKYVCLLLDPYAP